MVRSTAVQLAEHLTSMDAMPGRHGFQFSLFGMLLAVTYFSFLFASLGNELLLVLLITPILSFVAGVGTTLLVAATLWMLAVDYVPTWVPMSVRRPWFLLLIVATLLFCGYVLWDMSGGLNIYSADPGWPRARMLFPWLVCGGALLGAMAAVWIMRHPDVTNRR